MAIIQPVILSEREEATRTEREPRTQHSTTPPATGLYGPHNKIFTPTLASYNLRNENEISRAASNRHREEISHAMACHISVSRIYRVRQHRQRGQQDPRYH